MKREKSLTERVIVNFCPEDLKELRDYCDQKREKVSSFVRRVD